jgi:hypothetical protein
VELYDDPTRLVEVEPLPADPDFWATSSRGDASLPPFANKTRQSFRPRKKDQNEQDHSNGVLVGGGDQNRRKGFDESEYDPADHRAADAGP